MSNSISHSHLKWDLWMVAALVCVAVVLGIYPADRTVWFAGRRMGRAEGHPLRHTRRTLRRDVVPVKGKENNMMKKRMVFTRVVVGEVRQDLQDLQD